MTEASGSARRMFARCQALDVLGKTSGATPPIQHRCKLLASLALFDRGIPIRQTVHAATLLRRMNALFHDVKLWLARHATGILVGWATSDLAVSTLPQFVNRCLRKHYEDPLTPCKTWRVGCVEGVLFLFCTPAFKSILT